MPHDNKRCSEAGSEEPEEMERQTGLVMNVEWKILEGHKTIDQLEQRQLLVYTAERNDNNATIATTIFIPLYSYFLVIF